MRIVTSPTPRLEFRESSRIFTLARFSKERRPTPEWCRQCSSFRCTRVECLSFTLLASSSTLWRDLLCQQVLADLLLPKVSNSHKDHPNFHKWVPEVRTSPALDSFLLHSNKLNCFQNKRQKWEHGHSNWCFRKPSKRQPWRDWSWELTDLKISVLSSIAILFVACCSYNYLLCRL